MNLIIIANLSFIYFYLKSYFKSIKRQKQSLFPIILITAAVYLLLFYRFRTGTEFTFLITITSILIIILVVDLFEMLIPDSLILMMVIVNFIYILFNYLVKGVKLNIFFHLSGLLLGGLIFLIIIFLSKGGMGLGDVTLISAIGFIVGPYYILLNILLSFFIGTFISIFLLLTKIKSNKDPIPFGPFIISAFYITILYGDKLINWYINLL